MHLPKRQNKRDRDYRQRARELDDSCLIERVGTGVHTVPSSGGGCYRRGVVYRRAGKQTKALVAQPQHGAQRRKHKRGDDVEQEDNADRLRNLLVFCLDDRGSSGNGASTADGAPNRHKRCRLAGNIYELAACIAHDKRGGDGGHDHRQRAHTHLRDLHQVEPKAKQDNGILQHLLRGEFDAVFYLSRALGPCHGHNHSQQDAKNRASHHGQRHTCRIAGDGQNGAKQQAGAQIANRIQIESPLKVTHERTPFKPRQS